MLIEKASISVVFHFIIIVLSLIVYFKKQSIQSKYITIILIFSIWVLSGRVIGVKPYGELSSGWFNIRFNEINICKHSMDCEKTYYYETEIKELSFWRVKVKNNNIDEEYFVGPILWEKALSLLNKEFPSSMKSQ